MFNWSDLGLVSLSTSNVKGSYKKNDVYLFNVGLQMKNLPWAGSLMF